MKKTILLLLLLMSSLHLLSQDSTINKAIKWLSENNFSIRKTFDGSKDESKPAGILFRENHRSANDFINVDLAIKLSQLELLKNSTSAFILYPKVEWHKSTDSTDRKNKIDGGLNFEFFPFGLKSPNLPPGLPNKGLKISPWIQGTSSFKRNLIDRVYETKLVLQISFASNYKYLPGASWSDKNNEFRLRYYPYFGIEYNRLPNLLSKGRTEEFTNYFIRFFAEVWIIPRTLQLNLDGTYRQILNNKTTIRTWLPIVSPSIYFYPGKQETIGVGFEFKYGYDTNSTYQLVKISSLTLSMKI